MLQVNGRAKIEGCKKLWKDAVKTSILQVRQSNHKWNENADDDDGDVYVRCIHRS